MLFLAYCSDAADAPLLRRVHLAEHLAWVASEHTRIRVAGPLRDGAGRFTGSVLVVEADDTAAAEALLASDPYRYAGVWRTVELRAFQAAAGTWLQGDGANGDFAQGT